MSSEFFIVLGINIFLSILLFFDNIKNLFSKKRPSYVGNKFYVVNNFNDQLKNKTAVYDILNMKQSNNVEDGKPENDYIEKGKDLVNEKWFLQNFKNAVE